MVKHISNLPRKLNNSFYGFFISYALLLLSLGYWNVTRSGGILWVVWILQSLPLLVFLPGLLKPYYRSYSWFCFLLLLYFVVGVEGSFKSTARFVDYLFLALTVLLFIFAMLRSRWLQYALVQEDKAIADNEKEIKVE